MDIDYSEYQHIAAASRTREELWCRILELANVRAMAEVGVWKGDFAEHILKQCAFITHYYMIDPWARLPDWDKPLNVETEVFNEVYAEAMRKTEFAAGRIVVLRGRTKDVIDNIPDDSLDFVYIDGDHTLRGITLDLIKLFPKIREGGLIGGDDFTNNPWQHDARFEPTLVCPFSIYFSEAMDVPITALPFNQFLIHKDPDTAYSFTDLTGGYGDISLNKLPSRSWSVEMKKTVRSVLRRTGMAGY